MVVRGVNTWTITERSPEQSTVSFRFEAEIAPDVDPEMVAGFESQLGQFPGTGEGPAQNSF